VLDIVPIESDLFVERIMISPIYLCHTRDTWTDREELMIGLSIELDFARLMWTRSYEWHIPLEDIPELWELIEGESLDESSPYHPTGIIADLVEWTITTIALLTQSILVLESLIVSILDSIGILHTVLPVHVSELVEKKLRSTESDTPISKYHWTREILDQYTNSYEYIYRGEYDKS
jgi:hypothetical protein